MIRIVNIIFGVLLAVGSLQQLAEPPVLEYTFQTASCGMFNCDAELDTSEVSVAPQCELRDEEDGSQSIICEDGYVGEVSGQSTKKWDCQTDGDKICGDSKLEEN